MGFALALARKALCSDVGYLMMAVIDMCMGTNPH